MKPRELVDQIEREPHLPGGEMERFRGYSLVGLPFSSGHILGLRRWPASSIGPAYTSIWHRDPDGRWTFYTDVAPRMSCNRYFGAEIDEVRECDIDIDWTGPQSFRVTTGEGEIDWRLELGSSRVSEMITTLTSNLPDTLWRKKPVLDAMGTGGGFLLRAGSLNLEGKTPNAQEFRANPLHIWTVPKSTATVNGVDLGEVGPIPEQVRLGDFWLPQRGLFVIAQVFMERFDPDRHRDRIIRAEPGIIDEYQSDSAAT